MRKSLQKTWFKLVVLAVVGLIFSWLYLTINTYGNWEFALNYRGKKILAFLLVGIGTSFATITFQTVTNNHFLTPSILGFDSLYALIYTVLFFFMGQDISHWIWSDRIVMFVLNVLLMVTLSTLLFFFLLRKGGNNLFLLLMVGMIIGTLFSSISTFLQVLLDPNEYDKLQNKLFASFGNVDTSLLWISLAIMIIAVSYLWYISPKLDVLHLGKEMATSLGINVSKLQWQLLIVISLLVALSTALVGPVTFLGFIVVNLTYQFLGTYKHRSLFIGSALIAVLLLVVGQFFVEQVFKWNTTMSVIIQFIGGIYFVGKILHERKRGS